MSQAKRRRTNEYLNISFNIPTIFLDLKKAVWLIVSLSLSAVLLAYVVKDISYHPVYRVEKTYYVTSRGINNDLLSNMSTAQSMAKRYSQIFSSDTIRKKVMENLGLEPGDFIISAEVVDETNIVIVRATADTPELAFRIMEIIVDNYPNLSKYLVTDAIINDLTALSVPKNKTFDLNLKKTMLKAFILAFGILNILVITVSCFRDTIRTGIDVERKLDSRYLGEIGYEREKNKKNSRSIVNSMLITNQSVSLRYVEAIEKICRKVINRMKRYSAHTLLITSCLENEGKSTVAANLAIAMTEQGKKVMLLDLDLKKPAQDKIFGLDKKGVYRLDDLLSGKCQYNQAVTIIGDMRIDAIINNKSFDNSTEVLSTGVLANTLEELKKIYDVIIIDSPPASLSADAEAIAGLVDCYLVVVREHMGSARQINDILDLLYGCPSHSIGCVVNAIHRGSFRRLGGRGFEREYGYYSNYN